MAEDKFKNTESRPLRQARVRRRALGRPFAALPRVRTGGDEVTYIIAWTLGLPVSLIILFLLLFGF
jgi:hypothetical protein